MEAISNFVKKTCLNTEDWDNSQLQIPVIFYLISLIVKQRGKCPFLIPMPWI